MDSGFFKTTIVVTIRNTSDRLSMRTRNKNMTVFVFMFHQNTQTVVFFLSINDFTFSLFIIIVLRSERRGK